MVAVALMVSCTQGEVLVDTENQTTEVVRSIGFNTFVEKATRATGTNSTALHDFYSTFYVYGWKTVGNDVTCVFENIPVEFFADDMAGQVVYTQGKPSDEWTFEAGSWYYQNIRYWDKMASSYQFCAFTPASVGVVFECLPSGVITIGTANAPVTVDTKNLMATPATALAYTGFDRDYMTATATDVVGNVSLNFSHLQAKFNIKINLDESIETAQDVSVQKIEVHNLGDKAYYESDATNAAGTVSGWTLGTASDDYVLSTPAVYSLNNANTNYNGYYVLEQLIIPQTVEYVSGNDLVSLVEYAEACVYVEYKIGGETFKCYTPLANIFSKNSTDDYTFEGGNQYTLNITVGPDPIKFEAEVTAWSAENAGDQEMD